MDTVLVFREHIIVKWRVPLQKYLVLTPVGTILNCIYALVAYFSREVHVIGLFTDILLLRIFSVIGNHFAPMVVESSCWTVQWLVSNLCIIQIPLCRYDMSSLGPWHCAHSRWSRTTWTLAKIDHLSECSWEFSLLNKIQCFPARLHPCRHK